MTRPTRPRLALEPLDDRSLPATVSFAAGVLSISHPTPVGVATTVNVNQTFPNSFVVADGATFYGPYAGVTRIRYTGSPHDDTVRLFLAGFDYNGSARFDTGAGTDTVEVRGQGGSIARGLAINPGAGADTVRLNSDAAAGDLIVFGPVTVTDPAGSDAISLGNAGILAPTRFLGDVRLRGMNTVRLAFGQSDWFRNFTASTAGDPNPLDFRTSATTTTVVVYGNLRLTGGAGDDTVLDSSLFVTGNVAINLGGTASPAGNDVTEWAGVPLLQVNGNYTYTGGPGSDEVILSGNRVNGNLTVNLRGGDNDSVDLSTVTTGTQPRVVGDLTIRTGAAGTTFFNGGGGEGVTAAVGGDFTVVAGGAGYTMKLVTPPDGVFRWTSGAGADALTLAPTLAGLTWDVRIRLGANNDALTLAIAGPGQQIDGLVDFGGQVTTDSFVVGVGWALDPGFTVLNLP